MLVQKYISFYEFIDSFSGAYKDNFSYEGFRALYDYLEEFEGEIDLDPIALCCEYTEYQDLKDLQANYSDITSIEDLENHTTVIMIPHTDRFIIQDY